MKVSDSQKRLYELMDAFGIKQQDICDKTGIDKSTMSLYLSGKRLPRQDKIGILSEAYQVDPAWLMGYDVEMQPSYNIRKAMLDAQISSLPEFDVIARGYINAPQPIKDAILTLLKPYA